MLQTPIPYPAPPSQISTDLEMQTFKHGTMHNLIDQNQDTLTEDLLAGLVDVDQLFITKRLRVRNVVFLKGKKNQFFVRLPNRDLVFTVEEENRWWVGYFCYGLRPLHLRVMDPKGQEVLKIHRPYAFTPRILPCQSQTLQVYVPSGRKIGTIQQLWSPIKPVYIVRNEDYEPIYSLNGPIVTLSCFRDLQFHIVRPDGTPVGGTHKRWTGFTHALFYAPISHNYGLNFDKNLAVEDKALLLAGSLLIDYMYYDI